MYQTRDRYGSCTLYPGQVLSGSHFRRQVSLRLQRRQRNKLQIVELFVESLLCNFEEMTASSPFMFVATNLGQ